MTWTPEMVRDALNDLRQRQLFCICEAGELSEADDPISREVKHAREQEANNCAVRIGACRRWLSKHGETDA